MGRAPEPSSDPGPRGSREVGISLWKCKACRGLGGHPEAQLCTYTCTHMPVTGLVNLVFHRHSVSKATATRLATAPAPKAGPFTTQAAHGGYPQLAWDSFHAHVVRSRVGAPHRGDPYDVEKFISPQPPAPEPRCPSAFLPGWRHPMVVILYVAQLSHMSQDGQGALSSPGVQTELPSFLL